MSTVTSDPGVDRFIAELEQELHEKKLTMLDSEILAALEAKQTTREQIGEWAKVFYAATRHGRMSIGNFYANAPDDDELRRELSMHAELDADHGEEFRSHALKVAAQPGGLEALRGKMLALAPLVRDIWNGYGKWKAAVH